MPARLDPSIRLFKRIRKWRSSGRIRTQLKSAAEACRDPAGFAMIHCSSVHDEVGKGSGGWWIMQVLGHGVYSLHLAARLTRLKQRRIREWFRGRPSAGSAAVFRSDFSPVDGKLSISFHDLIESFVAGQLREQGASLQRVRRVHAQLQADLGTRHPFCRREIMSNDGQVFTDSLDDQGRREMIEVLSKQRVFPDVLMPFLNKIDYDRTSELAIRWRIADSVVLDPAICLGKPIVVEVGIATSVLAASYEANERDAVVVADWFHVEPRHVVAAVDFERGLAA